MTKLEALNTILRRLGEAAVTSLDVPYPTVSLVLPALDEAHSTLLLDEWFFNKFQWRNLLPNQFGQVRVPDEVLVAYPEDVAKFTYTGRFIRDARTGEHVDEPVRCQVVLNVPFEELPQQAQLYVVFHAAHKVYTQDFGSDDIAAGIQQDAVQAYMQLSAQHTRQRKYNTRTRRNWQRMQRGIIN